MFDYSNVLNSSSKAWLHAADLTWIGTPLADTQPVEIFESVRLIAVTCIAITRARVRFAASRTLITREGQALCFFAGANSIFFGDKLLTAENPAATADAKLLCELGLNIEVLNETNVVRRGSASSRLR